MAQDPVQVDALQVEPGSLGTRLISRDATAGELLFTDPVNASGITLSGVAGLRSIGSVLVVGKSGPGAQYNTIQAAHDAAPSTASLTDPTLILVGPGVYQENVVIEKDGLWIMGLGGVVVDAAAADATFKIQQNVTDIPKWCRLQNLRILNANAGEECVSVLGGSTSEVGDDEIGIVDCELIASGTGSLQVYADTANVIRVQGGTFEGSVATSKVVTVNCHQVVLSGVERVYNVQLDYDTANPTPNQVGCSYLVKGSTLLGNIQSTLNGTGTLELASLWSPSAGDLIVNGDGAGTFRADGCRLGDLTVNGSAPLTLANCTRGTASGAGTLAETIQEGSVAFAASSSEAVTFGVGQPDANYQVHTETELTEAIGVTSKTTAGFTLSFSGAQTTTVNYQIVRRLS
jgi:hypothetical protein